MPHKYDNLEEAFTYLVGKYAVHFSEACILEEKEDIFYVSDPETYEIYYLYSMDPNKLATEWLDYKGKKCYALLQGRDAPCPFCTNKLLSKDQYYIWEYRNPLIERNFLLKDRLSVWNGKDARMEIALDVTNPERKNQLLFETVKQQNFLTDWIQALADANTLGEAFEKILPGFCSYFKAEYGFIRAFTETELVRTYAEEGKHSPFPFVKSPSLKSIERWGELLNGNKQFIVRSVAELAEQDPEGYEILKGFGLESFCITPILMKNRILGMIGIGNFHKHYDALFLLKVLSSCLATAVQRKTLQEEKFYIQYKDPLTGYLNFEAYKQEVDRILHANPGYKYSLWYCDIKKFKFINDVFGYDIGDRLLKYWTNFVADDTRPGETFCRISADNLTSLRRYEEVEELKERFDMAARKLSQFQLLKNKRFEVELVSGVYLIERQEDILDIGRMLNRANMAQKSVKSLPGSQLAFYTDEMRQHEIEEMTLISDLHEALRKEEFILYLQPQVDIQKSEQKVLWAEVLVRWNYNRKKVMMPGNFITLFEQNGMIIDLDYYMFEHACRLLSNLKTRCDNMLCLSVNVSRITILQPGFAEDYRDIKEKYGIPDGRLALEFTETGVVEDVKYFGVLVNKLQKYGFLCAMDDFGTGQSSLNILQSLPLDILKIDRQFFYGNYNKRRNQIIVSSILRMAKLLNMRTVAEGIESEGQVNLLKSMKCDYVQGYVFQKPLPAEQFLLKMEESL